MNPPVAELTVEEIAEGIAIRHAGPTTRERFDLTAEIEAALKARDERAVRIIQEHQDLDVCKDNCWTTIKAAIREGKE